MKAIRKQCQVRCYQIGSQEKYPHWLRKALAKKDVALEEHASGLTTVVTLHKGNKVQHYYDGDYLIKTPEGPIIGVRDTKFNELYEPIHPDTDVISILQGHSPEWATKAFQKGDLRPLSFGGEKFPRYLQRHKDNMYYTYGWDDIITYKEVYGEE